MKITNIFVALCLLTLFAIPAFAEDTSICFDVTAAQKLEVEIKECRVKLQTIPMYEDLNIKNEAEIKALNDKFEGCDKAVKEYEDLIKLKDKNCEAMIKAAKPNFFQQLLVFLGGGGIGVLIGVLAL